MAVTFQVTPESLRLKATELRNQKQRMATLLQNLVAQETALNAMWDGEANDAFHKEFTNSAERISRFCDMANLFAGKLEDIAAEYQMAESRNVGIANTRG